MRVASAQSLDTSVIKLIPKVLRKSVDLVSQLVVCTAVSTSPCMLSATEQPPKHSPKVYHFVGVQQLGLVKNN